MESSRGGRVDVFRQRAFLRHPGMRVCSFSKMRLIATVAENHHLRLSAARNLKNRTWATLVIPVSPMK